jgi:hypothetical protein
VVIVFAPDCERRFHERVPALPFLPSPEQKRNLKMLYRALEAAGGRCIQPKAGK